MADLTEDDDVTGPDDQRVLDALAGLAGGGPAAHAG